jgi:hypothetical protein
MATGRTTKVRSFTGSAVRARTVKVQSKSGTTKTARTVKVRSVVTSFTAARTVKMQSKTVGINPATATIEPFASVTLMAGSAQTGGPTVVLPTFAAPALPFGAVLTFSLSGSISTYTVLAHTFFALGTGGALSALNRNGATTTGTTPAPGTYSDTYTTGY